MFPFERTQIEKAPENKTLSSILVSTLLSYRTTNYRKSVSCVTIIMDVGRKMMELSETLFLSSYIIVLAVLKLYVVLLNRQKHTEPDFHLSFWLRCCHAYQQVFFIIGKTVLS